MKEINEQGITVSETLQTVQVPDPKERKLRAAIQAAEDQLEEDGLDGKYEIRIVNRSTGLPLDMSTQTQTGLHPNQQDPATLLAPESAPEHHKTYWDRRDTETPVDADIASADEPSGRNGSGTERWPQASDWTAAKGEGLEYPS